MSIVDDLLAKFQMQQDQANAANEARYSEGMGIYDDIIAQYMPGGSFGAGMEAQIEKGATKAVAQGTQALVSSGLYGTTTQANLRKKYEEDVAGQQRLNLEDLRADRLAQARAGKAGFIERREDTGPSDEVIANLTKAAASRASGGGYTAPFRYTTIDKSKYLGSGARAPSGSAWVGNKLFSSQSEANRYMRHKAGQRVF